MKKYKLLVCDYDGTLVDDNKNVSKATLDSINGFIERGGIFVVCTGRMTSGIDYLLKGFGLNCLLASFNGAELVDLKTDKVLYRYPIDNKTCIEVFKFLENYKDLNVQCYPGRVFMAREENEWTKWYSKVMKTEVVIKNPVSEYLEESKASSNKILVFDDSKKLDRVFLPLKEKFSNLEVIRSNDVQIDINLKNVNKGTACENIAKYFSLSVDDVLAVGDAGNDIPMLKSAGFSVAMGNASDEVKNLCDAVTKDNNSDGIKFLIDKYCI